MFDLDSPKAAGQESLLGAAIKRPTVTEVLQEKAARLTAELEATEDALLALKANPEIEKVINLVQRASRGY